MAKYPSQTKATGDTVAFTGTSFGVYAWYDAKNNITAESHQSFMDNVKIAPASAATQTAGTTWKAVDGVYFWPKSGDIDFISYYPYVAPSEENVAPWITINDAANQITGTFFSEDGNEDYMYSDFSEDYSGNAKEFFVTGVPVLFHHALAQVTVNFKAETLGVVEGNDWKIVVHNAEFVGLHSAGTVTLNLPADRKSGTGVKGWTLPTNEIWTATDDADDIIAADEYELTTDFVAPVLDGYTVLPQSLAGKTFHINYTIQASNDGKAKDASDKKYYSTETIDKYLKLDDTKELGLPVGPYWQMNKKIQYNITISPNSTNQVTFDPAVVDWDDVETGEITIK